MNPAAAAAPRWRDARVGGCVDATLERRADGAVVLRSVEPLAEHAATMNAMLAHRAADSPERVFVAQRDPATREWRRITYAAMLARARAIGQALVDRGLSAERPVMILGGNSLEHLSIAFGAMWAGVPFAPVSPAYSLVSKDFAKLRHLAATLTPGLVVADDPSFAPAIAAAVAPDVPLVLLRGAIDRRAGPSVAFETLLAAAPGAGVDAAHAAVGPQTIVKFLFTSGSTKQPKAVVNTHRMWCANQQMIRQCLAFLADAPPTLVDWLPWNHTFGGNHNVGIALWNGGTLFIDDGKPTPAGIAETLANLREISPTIYFNVPKGLEEIARAMDADAGLRERFFADVRAFMFAGAGLSQPVWDALDRHGEAARGERVRIVTGLGMTETAPACTFAVGTATRSGDIGLPMPGVEVKLVPDAASGKREIRFRGPNVMPGYWRDAAQTAAAFDDEGFYRTGDAAAFVDESQPARGLRFDGRIAEDFKLATGTFVSVGPLRARIIQAGDPCVQDAVIAGIDRDEVAALVFPRADDCRRLAGLPDATPLPDVLRHPAVRAFFQRVADALAAQASGSASRVARLHVLAEPASIDRGEVTDKGSINQRAVLAQRAALVDAVYAHDGRAAGEAEPFVIRPSAAGAAR